MRGALKLGCPQAEKGYVPQKKAPEQSILFQGEWYIRFFQSDQAHSLRTQFQIASEGLPSYPAASTPERVAFRSAKTIPYSFRGRERSDQRKAAKNSTEWPKGHSVECASAHQYMPPMSPPAAGAAGAGAGMSATRDSVVSTIAATEAAFCSAERVTLVGSIMPRSIMSTYSSFSAS